MSDEVWPYVPDAVHAAWRATLNPNALKANVFLNEPCPICGRRSLRHFSHSDLPTDTTRHGVRFTGRGVSWEWCAACHHWEMRESLVPEGWEAIDLPNVTINFGMTPEKIDAGIRLKFGVGDDNP